MMRRWLSHDEAETVLSDHFVPGEVEALVRSGCYVVRWWPVSADQALGANPQALEGESLFSFEEAIRELASQRPYLVRVGLDDPVGMLRRLAWAGADSVTMVP